MSESLGFGPNFKTNHTFVAGLTWDQFYLYPCDFGQVYNLHESPLTLLINGGKIINTFHYCYQLECKMKRINTTYLEWLWYDDNVA